MNKTNTVVSFNKIERERQRKARWRERKHQGTNYRSPVNITTFVENNVMCLKVLDWAYINNYYPSPKWSPTKKCAQLFIRKETRQEVVIGILIHGVFPLLQNMHLNNEESLHSLIVRAQMRDMTNANKSRCTLKTHIDINIGYAKILDWVSNFELIMIPTRILKIV